MLPVGVDGVADEYVLGGSWRGVMKILSPLRLPIQPLRHTSRLR
jgi:hypothetical protein